MTDGDTGWGGQRLSRLEEDVGTIFPRGRRQGPSGVMQADERRQQGTGDPSAALSKAFQLRKVVFVF